MAQMVVDACSIILLAKAEVLEIITGSHNLTLTKEVYGEVMAGKSKMFPDALLIEKLVKELKIKVISTDLKLTLRLEQDFNMGSGEASVIAEGIRFPDKIVATDNRQGRMAAKINKVKVIGSIEIIVALYKSKKINKDNAKAALKALQEEGWFEPLLIERAEEDLK